MVSPPTLDEESHESEKRTLNHEKKVPGEFPWLLTGRPGGGGRCQAATDHRLCGQECRSAPRRGVTFIDMDPALQVSQPGPCLRTGCSPMPARHCRGSWRDRHGTHHPHRPRHHRQRQDIETVHCQVGTWTVTEPPCWQERAGGIIRDFDMWISYPNKPII